MNTKNAYFVTKSKVLRPIKNKPFSALSFYVPYFTWEVPYIPAAALYGYALVWRQLFGW